MFTWLPIHAETARRLLDYENRQADLLALLEQMAASGSEHHTDSGLHR